ncbi:HAD hydrolase-like protein [Neobacillus drentensis]|uniref:HAD family hydrolase n=1 Tax=Neobacillus drentensis TaxID=220684 RepID=UPI001F2A8419|nr:HAD family hydrolase [Neobacillus drentensis]ULT56074.1 HAD hydrolase-like protein [Neobacillus drentensis]
MINTVLFDVDGVLLSEEHYFDASALTVWEMLISSNYLALAPEQFTTEYTEADISRIRENVFQNDQVLKFMKSRGLNANWDMIYLSFGHQLIHLLSQIKEDEAAKIAQWLTNPIDYETLRDMASVLSQYQVELNFSLFVDEFSQSDATKQELFEYLNVLAREKLNIETSIFQKGKLWSICEHVSQEWYVGDEHVLASTGRPSVQTGKKGFLANETTLAPAQEIAALFQQLSSSGITIGIGTGRPELETIQPFHHLDWLKYFDEKRIITADEVSKAEQEITDPQSLSKPHPFTYIMGLKGKGTSALYCINATLPIQNGKEVLVVGDSLADLLAARQLGCQFAAVLTGLSGKDARHDFEQHKADFILDTVLDIKTIL